MRDFDKVKWKTWQRAREFRRDRTEAERLLWYKLRTEQLGVKFRRQHAIGEYIVDFICIERKLIVEVDGPTHAEIEQQLHDARRTDFLESLGYRVVRVTNLQVKESMPYVLETILDALKRK